MHAKKAYLPLQLTWMRYIVNYHDSTGLGIARV